MTNCQFLIGEKIVSVHSEMMGETIVVKVGENVFRFLPVSKNLFKLSHNGQTHIVAAIKNKNVYYIDIDATLIEVNEADAFLNVSAAAHHVFKDKVFAPMPGKIVKVMVKKGDQVTMKQPLAVVEAMKMENQINSPAAGRVKSVNFVAGDQVNTTSPIIELELESTA